uniref:Transposase (putative) YhgA-like domain-containing protein n=1 Tax=Candidatus Kentrum sp. FM TaxID=2126340 RepID=A0A450S2D7_9GAMM|nr:MAG: conserved hypothetical protein (putative transposase or invertase) [Candidatus Kentron sp. FM]VFJ45990.1 MAG: conserved hypothetical protein (putative transposase or invertase) [Candidatus Kentron sp. FM]VFK20703.1 MAG: conserved hypothetical protein (putative transposase or invertase) [Candidatus Kentron sp. FM]
MTDDIAHPHDRFMKDMLSRSDRAGLLLRERLPEAVTKHLSDDPPEPVQDSFVDEWLREYFSDRLFRVKTVNGQTAFLYVLIEHKSSPDKKVGWQLLKYMVEILKRWEKENPDWEKLPAIVPFVFYHGAEDWKIPNEFLHLVDAEDGWEPYLLNFRFPVLDLGTVPDTELSEHPRLRPWLAAMKYATRKDRQTMVVELLIALLKGAPEELEMIVGYLMRVYPYDKQTLEGIIRKVRPGEEEKMMSQFAQEIQSKALQEGIQQGEHKKAVDIAKAALDEGMEIGIVSKISGLSEEEIRELLVH